MVWEISHELLWPCPWDYSKAQMPWGWNRASSKISSLLFSSEASPPTQAHGAIFQRNIPEKKLYQRCDREETESKSRIWNCTIIRLSADGSNKDQRITSIKLSLAAWVICESSTSRRYFWRTQRRNCTQLTRPFGKCPMHHSRNQSFIYKKIQK